MRLDFRLDPRKIALVLAALALCFALQSLVADYLVEEVLDEAAHPYAVYAIDLFSANAEQTFPTWYAGMLLFAASILLSLIAIATRRTGGRDGWLWGGLAVVFLYLSLDEMVSIHEIAAEWLQTDFQFTGFFAFGWQLAAVPFLALFAVVYLRFWLRLPPRTRRLFLIAGIVYVGGAFVIEGISAAVWDSAGGISYPYLAIATVEELAEMLGVIVLIYALLDYAAGHGIALTATPVTEAGASAAGIKPSRLLLVAAGLAIVVNLAVIAWAAGTAASDKTDTAGRFVYPSLVDQLALDGVVVTRAAGQFSFSAPPDPIVTALAERFASVTVVNLISSDSYLVLAADGPQVSREALIEVLHNNGETQFVILEDAAVRMVLDTASGE